MRVLIIHNKYQQRGGEDTLFEQEYKLLEKTENVKTLIFQNLPGWKGALQFLFSIWNIFAVARIKKTIKEFRPDIVHLHNWHYAIGPIVIRTTKKNNVPIVLTIHNYRLLCPSAILFYKDSLFLNSIHASFPWEAVKKKVYRNSKTQTFWLAFIVWFHKKIGTWKMVDRMILLTDSAKNIFLSSSLGIGESQLVVKPNFIEEPKLPKRERKDFFLFIGRLSEEKGINVLLEAFKKSENELYIAGDGPLKETVIQTCKQNPKIHYSGLLQKNAVQQMMTECTALIFPSLWYEGMPMTLIEAFATGTPVIASDVGAMASMIENGYNGIHFGAGNSVDLNNKINYYQNLSNIEKEKISYNARLSFENNYMPEQNKEQLLSIYESAIKNKPFN